MNRAPAELLFAVYLACALPQFSAWAGVHAWSGGGADDKWTTPENWGGGVAPPGTGLDEVRLNGTTRPTPNVDQPWSLADLLYTAATDASFTLGGSALTLTAAGAITVQDSAVTPQTINNAITFTGAAPVIYAGYARKLILGGVLGSASTLYVSGKGSNSTVEIAAGGSINAPAVEVTAASASYDNVILKLNHSNAITDTATLRITPSADGTKRARVNLNFTGTETVAGLVLDGTSFAPGVYNAASHPDYFTGTGNIEVGSVFAGIVENGLLCNWDAAGAGATPVTWTSANPASDLSRQWDISAPGVAHETADPSATTGVNASYGFDASTSSARATAPTFNNLGGSVSFEFWIKPATLGGGRQVIFETGNLNYGLAVVLNNAQLQFITKHNNNQAGSPNNVLGYKLQQDEADDFIQVVAVSDTTGGFNLYVNPLGEIAPETPKATEPAFGNWAQGTAGAGLGGFYDGQGAFSSSVGSWQASMWGPFNGRIGAVRVYQRALTAGEVLQNFQAVAWRDASEATPVTQFAEWGPNWGRGGLGRFYMNSEGRMSPQPGDIENNQGLFGAGMMEWRAVTAEAGGLVNFKDAAKFPRVSSLASGVSAFGAAEHLHTYVKASDTQPVNAIFYAAAHPNMFFLWLNGAPVAAGQIVTLQPGWNRLMIRACSDANNVKFGGGWSNPWDIQVKIGSGSGGPLSGLQFRTDDPERKVLVTDEGRNYRYLSSLKRAVDGDQTVFVNGEAVAMTYTLKVGLGTGPQYQIPYTPTPTTDYDRYQLLKGLNWVFSVDPAQVAGGSPAWTVITAGGVWPSSAPASDTTRQWNTGAAGITFAASPDPSPATGVDAAFGFDGSTAAVATVSGNFSAVGQNATFEFWIKPSSLTGGKQVIFETGDRFYGLAVLLNNGTLNFITKHSNSEYGGPSTNLNHTISNASDFIQVVAVSDSVNGYQLYVNSVGEAAPGTPKNTTATVGNWTQSTRGAGLGGKNDDWGALSSSGGSWLKTDWLNYRGQAGFIRVYNRVLSGAEVAQNFAAVAQQSGGIVTNSLLYNWDASQGAAPTGNWASHAPKRVNILVLNSADQTVLDQTVNLDYGPIDANEEITATVNLNLGALGLDHYKVFTCLLDADDSVQARDRAHAFAVTLGSVDRTKDQQPRLMGNYHEWLLSFPPDKVASKLRYLHRLGITKHQGVFNDWGHWGISQDGNGNVSITDAPEVDAMLATAASLGIEVIGQLSEGIVQSGSVLVQPTAGPAFPAYGTPEWNQTFHDFAWQLVNRYKDRIHTWGGKNEIDINMQQADLAAAVHADAAAQMWQGLQDADAAGIYVKSSLVRGNSSTTPNLKNHGFLNYGQGTDVHVHPGIAPDLSWPNLSEGSNEGRAMLSSYGYTGQVWFGEINSPESRNYWGAQGSAGDLIKQMAWAINLRDAAARPVKAMMYLTAFNGDDIWSYNDGFNNQMGDPLPQACTAGVVNHWLDGRSLLPPLGEVSSGVEHIRVDVTNLDAAHPQAVALWNDANNLWQNGINATCGVTLSVSGTDVIVINCLGHESSVPASGGKVTIQAGPMPVIVRGTFTDGQGTPPPSAPTELSATGGNSQVALSWTASVSGTSYIIKRADSTGGPYSPVASGVTGTSHIDGGLADGTAHYYVIAAVGGGGLSENSLEAGATTYTRIENWRGANFGTTEAAGIAADDADPDADGRINKLEYVVDSNPQSSDAAHAAEIGTTQDGLRLTLTFLRIDDPSLSYHVEASDVLSASWDEIWSSTGPANVAGTVIVEDPEPIAGHARRFLRLRVE